MYQHHLKPSVKIINSNLFKLASIRDPWSFYLSLWTYGCKYKSQSGPYNALTKLRPIKGRSLRQAGLMAPAKMALYLFAFLKEDSIKNLKLYADANDPDRFDTWLRKILDPKFAIILSGSYYNSGLHKFSGLFTYRYCNLYCSNEGYLHSGNITNLNRLKDSERVNCYIDYFLHTHSLHSDFEHFVHKHTNFNTHSIKDFKFNASKPKGKVTKDFYPTQNIRLVEEKEALLCDKFNYNFSRLHL